jgi:hypothetical protein
MATVPGVALTPAPANAVHERLTTAAGKSPRWSAMPIRYAINREGTLHVANGSEFGAVHAAFRTWEDAPGSAIDFQPLPDTVAGFGQDGVSTVTFAVPASVLGSSTLAATFSFWDTAGDDVTFREADIVFNPSFPLSTSGEPGAFDIQSVATHEVGHLLGLDHSAMVSSVMSPFAERGDLGRRPLQSDDVVGARAIYPDSVAPPGGTIRGTIRLNGQPVWGAHIVATGADGTAITSILSRTDGTYELIHVPPGNYTVHAEPLDGVVRASSLSGYFAGVHTHFQATYFGNVAHWSQAVVVGVSEGITSAGVDIAVAPRGTTGLVLAAPVNPVEVAAGATRSLIAGGTGVGPGVTFSISTESLSLGGPVFGGRLTTNAPTSATMDVTALPEAAPGPKTLAGRLGDTTRLVTGAVIVTDAPPRIDSLSGVTGAREGGTVLQIEGDHFRPGVGVQFGGVDADVIRLNPRLLQVTTPPNAPGTMNVVAVNADGTFDILADGFTYTAPPPSVTAVSPREGPPGARVVIDGAHFDALIRNVVVRFGGVGARVVASSESRIEAIVPFGASTGELTVHILGNTASGGIFIVDSPAPGNNHAPDLVSVLDASAGTRLAFPNQNGFHDDGIAQVSLPFDFALFTDTFVAGERISVATNGWISLVISSTPEFQNPQLPAATVTRPSGSVGIVPAAMIAPFFDDLTFAAGHGGVRTRTVGQAPNRILVVDWESAGILTEDGERLEAEIGFQLQLYEGSNDIRFVYRSVSGPRSDGSSATVGLQNLARDRALQTGFNEPVVEPGGAVTYRFDNGAYTADARNQTPPGAPRVSDGGARTATTDELIATWTAPDTGGEVAIYEYAIGTTPGGADVRAFTSVEANSVVASGLALGDQTTYYFAVRGRTRGGIAGPAGISDGILLDSAFTPSTSVFPYVTHGTAAFAGLAIMAHEAADVVLHAVDASGNTPVGPGITNPVAVHLEAGAQWSRLVNEAFGLGAFDGWIEVESSSPTARVYAAMGARDLSYLDGLAPAAESSDFHLLHEGAVAMLVNPGEQPVTATIAGPDQTAESLRIPPRSRRSIAVGPGTRVMAPVPIPAVEIHRANSGPFGATGSLALTNGAEARTGPLVFPHTVVGGGYRSVLTLGNSSATAIEVQIAFRGESRSVELAPGRTTGIPIRETFDISGDAIRTGAVRVTSPANAPIAGAIDIALPTTMTALDRSEPATSIVFPHMAELGGFFTGIAVAAGNSDAELDIRVFDPEGTLLGSATFHVPAGGELARLVRELVPDAPPQNGGYIRLESDTPVWAWEIYGTPGAMASGPPL